MKTMKMEGTLISKNYNYISVVYQTKKQEISMVIELQD